MSESSDLEQLSAPSIALPPEFTLPPDAPVPTAADFAAASTPSGAGIAQTNPPTPWWYYALAVGGAALVAYVIYRVKFALPSYTQLQETTA